MSKYGIPRTSKGLATLCAKIADDKLAYDILIINLSKVEYAPADFFVICSCDSDVQVEAVVNAINRTCKNLQLLSPKVEGLESKEWVLMDFFDVVVHVFHYETRNFYKLEKLWGDGQFFELNDSRQLRKVNSDEILSVIKDKVL